MRINIRASEQQKNILLARQINPSVAIIWFDKEVSDADGYIDLLYENGNTVFKSIAHKPVIVNEVVDGCDTMPSNYCRINAWNSFLEKTGIEFTTTNIGQKAVFENILNQLGFKCFFVEDIAGMIAARSVAMIINEAFFGLEDDISTKEQIDTAMKLGTNYPFGPFEWAEKIGHQHILRLLNKLYQTDERYQPCHLLITTASLTS